MQNIVYQLLAAERSLRQQEELPLDHISQYAPFFEIDPHWEPDNDELISKIQNNHKALGYRIFNTHLRWDMLPGASSAGDREGSAKYIFT